MRLDNFDEQAYNEALFSGISIVTFTGTQNGMTKRQKTKVAYLLSKIGPKLLLHGDCVGADSDAHLIARGLGITIHIRPCTISAKRAYTDGYELAPPEDPIARNHKMVDSCDGVIATPKGPETLRSGTWATVRYAQKTGRSVWIVYPDGSVINPDGTVAKD